MHLASRVKNAYKGDNVPSHEGWSAQREALRWLVDKGVDGVYALEEQGLKVKRTTFRTYFITDGNHRALALYILGQTQVRACLKD